MSRSSLKNVSRLLDEANHVSKEPIEAQFLSDLKRSIEMTDAKGRSPGSKTFKPSGMNCFRSSYYQIMGEKPDDTPNTFNSIQIQNSGSDIHERVQNAVSLMWTNNMPCEYIDVAWFVEHRKLTDLVIREKHGFETKLYNKKYNMSFMCDGIIRYKKKYYILEIKTETSSKWYAREGVDPKHYNQGIAYSLSMGLNDVIFLYVDRDMLNMKTFMFNVTDDMRQTIIDYIEYVNGYIKRKIVPPKPNVDKRVCNFCGYRERCKLDN